ncbi:hypothetical protein LC065_16975 [Halobacillus litoralis]|uniref:hypothetical protein n=1 Tax=Halobacillus litoralis TaxID=45668 RepID=UPI001CFDC1CD|nr:hypothetical protein [Halobacillus litoralis]WLR47195.1 hypothetical protein LC065_16975 [Halobacillus litoralis]
METQWNIEEVKRLKKKQLLHSNLVLLAFFALFIIYALNEGTLNVVIGFFCVILWGIAANTLYTIITGKVLGSKTYRRVLAFDIDNMGKERWKQRKFIEFTVLIVLCLGITVVLFTIDFGSARLDFPLDVFPMLGGWIGMNIGQIARIKNLT